MLKYHKIRDRWAGSGTNTKGFTLIELLVVVVILGILAAVVVFSVSGFSEDAQTSACATEMRTLEIAIETYYAEHRVWPPSLGDLEGAGLVRSVSFAGDYAYDSTDGGLTLNTCPDP